MTIKTNYRYKLEVDGGFIYERLDKYTAKCDCRVSITIFDKDFSVFVQTVRQDKYLW